MPSNAHLDKGRRRYTYDGRVPAQRPANPVYAARQGCHRRGLDDEQTGRYLDIFEMIRTRELNGFDTHALYLAFECREDHLAVAAYTEAVASTRAPGWAE